MCKTVKMLEFAKSVGIEFALNQDKDIGRFLELFLDRYLYEVSLHDYWNIMDFFNSHKINMDWFARGEDISFNDLIELEDVEKDALEIDHCWLNLNFQSKTDRGVGLFNYEFQVTIINNMVKKVECTGSMSYYFA